MRESTINFFSRNPRSLDLGFSWSIDALIFKLKAGMKSKKTTNDKQLIRDIDDAIGAIKDCINFEMIHRKCKNNIFNFIKIIIPDVPLLLIIHR